ncbi:hypothetical protein A3K92_01030 [Thermococcus gorgonarius]|uniref:Uncharacterized protein n=1 Tax=Thermococcus gorgonarius TaxID=71997 RepID=A0A2Z2MDL8_THEGO|nr:hypothetical protein [Thermococcus gorgonarius]ASJ00168.1 hypothetical protein A3K92_01030 [Thermococcus gorgonarius]
MAKFMVYNTAGLTLPVEAKVGSPFYFECPEEECGKKVVLEGIIIEVSEAEFNKALESTIEEDPNFKPIEKIEVRKYVFRGRVNGKEVELPAESLVDFAKRFIENQNNLILL